MADSAQQPDRRYRQGDAHLSNGRRVVQWRGSSARPIELDRHSALLHDRLGCGRTFELYARHRATQGRRRHFGRLLRDLWLRRPPDNGRRLFRPRPAMLFVVPALATGAPASITAEEAPNVWGAARAA